MIEPHSRTLTWIQPSRLRPEFQLVSNDVPVATLRWEDWTAARGFGAALAECAEGKWRFIPSTKGLLHGRVNVRSSLGTVTVRSLGSEAEIARIKVKATGPGLVEFSDGRALQWNSTRGFWHPFRDYEWELINMEGGRLLRIDRRIFRVPFSRPTGRVQIEKSAELVLDLRLLTLLALFLIVRKMY